MPASESYRAGDLLSTKLSFLSWEFPKIRGALFEVHYNKDPTIY